MSKPKHHHYKLIDMRTFGGPESNFPETIPFINASGELNHRGAVARGSATSTSTTSTSNFFMPVACGGISGTVPFVYHAFEWRDGIVTDLGALPGADNCSGAAGINANGEVVGSSENAEIDPLTGTNQTRPVRWEDGYISDLGSFGGGQGTAISINDSELIVGGSLNTTADSFSIFDVLVLGFPQWNTDAGFSVEGR